MMNLEYQKGDRVMYDENSGTVMNKWRTWRGMKDEYIVAWDNGNQTIEWGSDLRPEGIDDI